MARKLSKPGDNPGFIRLSKSDIPLRISIENKLDNGYEIKDMNQKNITDLHRFVSDTVYKGLSISDVDSLNLRKEGLSDAPKITNRSIELVHYGKDRSPFRVFGYFNEYNYFVLCRIDGRHSTKKQ